MGRLRYFSGSVAPHFSESSHFLCTGESLLQMLCTDTVATCVALRIDTEEQTRDDNQ